MVKRGGEMRFEFLGTDPKNLRIFSDFGLWSGYAAVAELKLRGGFQARHMVVVSPFMNSRGTSVEIWLRMVYTVQNYCIHSANEWVTDE